MKRRTERPRTVVAYPPAESGHTHIQSPAESATTDLPHMALSELRAEIDRIDGELVGMIATRCELARNAGASKRAAGLPLLDPSQEAAVVRRVAERARQAGLEEEPLRQMFWCLIDLSRQAQIEGGE